MSAFAPQTNVSGISPAFPTNWGQMLRDNPWEAINQAFTYSTGVQNMVNQSQAAQQNAAQRVSGELYNLYNSSPLLNSFRARRDRSGGGTASSKSSRRPRTRWQTACPAASPSSSKAVSASPEF